MINEGIKPHDIDIYMLTKNEVGEIIYCNIITGNYINSKPSKEHILVYDFQQNGYCVESSGDYHLYADYVYDKENDYLVMFMMRIKICDLHIGDIRKPEIVERIDIKHNKKILRKYMGTVYDTDLEVWEKVDTGLFDTLSLSPNDSLLYDVESYEIGCDSFLQEIYKIFPKYVIIQGNRIIKISKTSELFAFLSMKEPFLRKKDKNKQIERLLSITPADVNISCDKNIIKKCKMGLNGYCVIQRIGEWCVLRTFAYGIEGGRIYFGKDKIYACKKSNNNEYVGCSLRSFFCSEGFKSSPGRYILNDSGICDVSGTVLEYYMPYIKELDNETYCRYKAIYMFSEYPIMEKLAKSCLWDVVRNIISKSCSVNPFLSVENTFGLIGKSNEKLYRALKLNKHQCHLIADYYKNEKFSEVSLTYIRKILYGRVVENDLSSIDNRMFDDLFRLCNEILLYSNGFGHECMQIVREGLVYTRTVVGIKGLIRLLEIFKKFLFESWCYRESVWAFVWRDYIRTVCMLKKLKSCPEKFNIFCDDWKQISDLHDEAAEYYEYISNDYDETLFDNRKAVWEKLIFEDDKFIVMYPQSPSDVVLEGIKLKHCVGTYIESIADGNTNIVFIRKKEAPDQPYLTVEISNKMVIEQIHGFANMTVSEKGDKKILSFIETWSEAKGLKLSDYDKIR